MAILNITDLTEVESSALTDSDMLVVGTSSGAKKIKANSLGGGGGADVFLVNFTTQDGETFTADKTIRQIAQAIRSGAIIKGVFDTTAFGGTDVYFFNIVSWEPLDDEDWETADSGTCTITFVYFNYEGGLAAVRLVGRYKTSAGAHQFSDYWTANSTN